MTACRCTDRAEAGSPQLHWVNLYQWSETKSTFMVRSALLFSYLTFDSLWNIKNSSKPQVGFTWDLNLFKSLNRINFFKMSLDFFSLDYFGSRFWILVSRGNFYISGENSGTVWYLKCINANFSHWCLIQINPNVFGGIELVFFQDLEASLMNYFTLELILCYFFQMNVLFLVVLCGGLFYANSESSMEPLMDHGQCFLPK